MFYASSWVSLCMDDRRFADDPVREHPAPGPAWYERGGPRSFPFELSMDVPANTPTTDPVTQTVEVPYDGRVTTVVIGWPSGTDKGVGVKIRDNRGHQYVPYNTDEEYIAADNFTHPFAVHVDIEEDDELVAEFVNATSEDHLVNVFPEISEEQ